MSRTMPQAVRELCLSFPESEEVTQHGVPNFKVAGKTFAMYCVNHHGDGRVALWLNAPPGTQELHHQLDPKSYFIPPYVGPRGWLGVALNSDLTWDEIRARVVEACEHAAPRKVDTGAAASVPPPNVALRPEDINPMLAERAREVLAALEDICGRFPETTPGDGTGNPAWNAGRKVFLRTGHTDGRMKLMFRVGVENQSLFAGDSRYSIPPYIGPQGWIALDVEDHANRDEIAALAEASYRRVALKRMIKALDG